jgi:hypothetical protein
VITLDGISLPEDLLWTDEYQWSPVQQTVDVALNGSLIVQESAQQGGRPITLAGDSQSAWVTKATLELLRAKAEQAGLEMTLDYHGTTYQVIFRRDRVAPIDARQVVGFANPQSDDYYMLTIRLMAL